MYRNIKYMYLVVVGSFFFPWLEFYVKMQEICFCLLFFGAAKKMNIFINSIWQKMSIFQPQWHSKNGDINFRSELSSSYFFFKFWCNHRKHTSSFSKMSITSFRTPFSNKKRWNLASITSFALQSEKTSSESNQAQTKKAAKQESGCERLQVTWLIQDVGGVAGGHSNEWQKESKASRPHVKKSFQQNAISNKCWLTDIILQDKIYVPVP